MRAMLVIASRVVRICIIVGGFAGSIHVGLGAFGSDRKSRPALDADAYSAVIVFTIPYVTQAQKMSVKNARTAMSKSLRSLDRKENHAATPPPMSADMSPIENAGPRTDGLVPKSRNAKAAITLNATATEVNRRTFPALVICEFILSSKPKIHWGAFFISVSVFAK